ncbi:MAG: divergent polysaccharide deacetylase family protein, partial [Alphaproteobacteria bacterium]
AEAAAASAEDATAAPPTATEATPAPAADEGTAASGGVRVALAPAPDPDLVESGPHGLLPVRAPDGRQPWRVYARPFLGDPVAPRVALVIMEVGLGAASTKAAIEELPPEVTLAISPYAGDPQEVARRARAAGHEVLLMVPMEPRDYPKNDPGPHVLRVDRPADEVLDNLHHVMSRFQGYVGIVNHMGSRFTAERTAVDIVIGDLAKRGLLVFDSRAAPGSLFDEAAGAAGLPHVANDRFIDANPSAREIDRNLETLVRLAGTRGHAVGIGRPYPVTIERIRLFAEGLAGRGVVLVPLSAVARQEGQRP